MNPRSVEILSPYRKVSRLNVGYVPENDCAPIVMAQEWGLYDLQGLDVELHRCSSWRQIHDGILQGELHAAQAPAMLPFLVNLGLTPMEGECLSGMVLSLQGNAITVSKELVRMGVQSAEAMQKRILSDRNRKIYIFGVSCAYSTQSALLRRWLNTDEVQWSPFVRFESVAPEQLYPLLKMGYLDGFCGAEPWNSVAMEAGAGISVIASNELAPLHPEKVLMVRRDFAEEYPEQHEALIASLLQAAEGCDSRQNGPMISSLLSDARYVNAPPGCLECDLAGPFPWSPKSVKSLQGLTVFSKWDANNPSEAKAEWLIQALAEMHAVPIQPVALRKTFRPEIFDRARKRAALSTPAHYKRWRTRSGGRSAARRIGFS